eukprot:GHRQ01035225.1.p1 GENE.GHRQ01035225.1~~GHRQ01035225.1.p1  ORF type:complete len:112 (+),score=6.13 GHRQ01035225.1:601-936(+)
MKAHDCAAASTLPPYMCCVTSIANHLYKVSCHDVFPAHLQLVSSVTLLAEQDNLAVVDLAVIPANNTVHEQVKHLLGRRCNLSSCCIKGSQTPTAAARCMQSQNHTLHRLC